MSGVLGIYIYTYQVNQFDQMHIINILSSSYTCCIHCTYLLESSWIHLCHNANDVMDYSKNGLQYTYRFHPPSLWKIMLKIWTRKTETQTRWLWWPIAGDIHMAHKWTQRLPQINLIQRIWCHPFSVKLDMEKSDLLPTQILSQTIGQEMSRQYFPPTFLISRSCFSVSLPCQVRTAMTCRCQQPRYMSPTPLEQVDSLMTRRVVEVPLSCSTKPSLMVCRRRSKGRCWNGNAKLYRSVSKNKRVKIRTNFRQCGKESRDERSRREE